MFTGHPKALYALSLANTGERFGYYTMLAIFTLYLQAKFGFTAAQTSTIFGVFLGAVYFMPLIGGILADKVLGFGRTVTIGIVVMFLGYAALSIPTGQGTLAVVLMFGALLLIATGTGLFKGNLQVMVGNLYEGSGLSGKRDTAFSIFYMAINVGALFAPTAATWVTNHFLGQSGLTYNARIPALAHQFLDGTISGEGTAELTALAAQQAAGITDLGQFSTFYIDKLGGAYNYGFAVACISLVLSILIFALTRRWWKHADYNTRQLAARPVDAGAGKPQELTPKQTQERVTALILVFAVVIFFWMSFHQNGLTMTYFARDYTADTVTGLDRIGFDVLNLTLILVAIYSLFSVFQSRGGRARGISGAVLAAAAAGLFFRYRAMDPAVGILPQIFQQFNPFFVVALTPVSLAIFGALARRGKEPSAPRKIGIGMVIAAAGFLVLALGSVGLATPAELAGRGGVSDVLVSPNWLIGTYLVLTFAELLLSPMGISFVSKVAPPKYKGAMMGGWFAATAVGNYLVSIIGYLWGDMELWMVWGILICCCLLSAAFIFSVLKRLERVTK